MWVVSEQVYSFGSSVACWHGLGLGKSALSSSTTNVLILTFCSVRLSSSDALSQCQAVLRRILLTR